VRMASSRKRDRAAGGDGTASAAAPDRLTLHVGGETFVTCRATLEPASSYFARRFSAEWSSGMPSEDNFLDRDADSFRILLSFMRFGHVSVLPREPALFARVLLDAEYLGIDSLIEQVKVRVQRHLHPDKKLTRRGLFYLDAAALADAKARWTAAAFDKEHGGLREALDSTWLMDRFFAPKPKSLYPKIVQLVPAQKTDRVVIHGGYHPGSQDASRSVHAFALVDHGDGRSGVEPMVATSNEDIDDEDERAEDEDAEDVHLAQLEPVSVLRQAECYGWYMANSGDSRAHGLPR